MIMLEQKTILKVVKDRKVQGRGGKKIAYQKKKVVSGHAQYFNGEIRIGMGRGA